MKKLDNYMLINNLKRKIKQNIMFTEITIKETGGVITHVTQQYKVGTYIIINNDPALQGTSAFKERDYHITLRKKVLKGGDLITNGTLLDYKGKVPINEFTVFKTK